MTLTGLANKYKNWLNSEHKSRKAIVSLDYYLVRRRYWRTVNRLTDKEKFSTIYKYNLWNNEESLSGGGSTLKRTENVRTRLPELIRERRIESIIDAGCGDFNWMKQLQPLLGVTYTGIDIVGDVIAANQARFGNAKTRFLEADIAADDVPMADLIICREVLFHLSYSAIVAALRNFKKSGSRYLLTTHYPDQAVNEDIESGSCRPINFEKAPFGFPSPVQVIDENTVGQCLALWKLADLNP